MRPVRSFGKLGKRAVARLAVGLEARLQLPDRTLFGAIDNISTAGCCIQVSPLPRLGVDAVVRIERIEAFCTVIWVRDGRCGLRFDRELEARAVERFRWIIEHQREHEMRVLGSAQGAWR